MENPIILVSGGTGVGTSTYSVELASALHIPGILSTDLVREVIRSIINPRINTALIDSTYAAGKDERYLQEPQEVQYPEIINAFKAQSMAVQVGLEGILRRAVHENIPLIIEGVHIIPGMLHKTPLYQEQPGRFIEYLIAIRDPELHRNHFLKRSQQAPARNVERYLKHFREIRWIHDYLLQAAELHPEIFVLNNGGELAKGRAQLVEHYHRRIAQRS